MPVRAKFRVDKIERIQGSVPVLNEETGKTEWTPGEIRSVILHPVYGNQDPEHENTKFWHASPSGEFRLDCANLAAVDGFELGQEYYIDITKAG
jgi:hypothetical protein